MGYTLSEVKAGDTVLLLGMDSPRHGTWLDRVKQVTKVEKVTPTAIVIHSKAPRMKLPTKHYYSRKTGVHFRAVGGGGHYTAIMFPTPQQLDLVHVRFAQNEKSSEEHIERQREYSARKDVQLRSALIAELEHNDDQYGPDMVPQLEAACHALGIEIPYVVEPKSKSESVPKTKKEMWAQIDAAVKADHWLSGIKIYRDCTGESLRDSREAVEKRRDKLRKKGVIDATG